MIPMRLIGVAVMLLAVPVRAAAGPDIEIKNFTFDPPALTVHAGAHVTFKNADDIPHSVVLADGSFRSRPLDTDDSVEVAFRKPGAYTYFCGLHPHMRGTIVVVP